MAKKTKERVVSSTFEDEKLLLLSERRTQGLSGDVSDEDVCVYAEKRYRERERKQATDRMVSEVQSLIRANEGDFIKQGLHDFSDELGKCEGDVERIRVCYRWIRMYQSVKSVTKLI